MKIKTLFLLTTALLFSGASLRATDSLCGGADDDQFRPPVNQGLVSDPLGVLGSPVPGHPTPLQPVLQGLVTDPLGLPPPPSGPQNPAIARLDQLDEASIRGLIRQAMWTDMSGPSLLADICGGNGNDSIHADSLLPRLRHAHDLIYGETGSDSFQPAPGVAAGDLNGDGVHEFDTIVGKLARFVAVGITGDPGNDTLRPSSRMARLQQVAFSTGARSDIQFLSGVIMASLTGDSMDDDDLWGGGGTDE